MRARHYVFATGFVWYVGGSLSGCGEELAFGHFFFLPKLI